MASNCMHVCSGSVGRQAGRQAVSQADRQQASPFAFLPGSSTRAALYKPASSAGEELRSAAQPGKARVRCPARASARGREPVGRMENFAASWNLLEVKGNATSKSAILAWPVHASIISIISGNRSQTTSSTDGCRELHRNPILRLGPSFKTRRSNRNPDHVL